MKNESKELGRKITHVEVEFIGGHQSVNWLYIVPGYEFRQTTLIKVVVTCDVF